MILSLLKTADTQTDKYLEYQLLISSIVVQIQNQCFPLMELSKRYDTTQTNLLEENPSFSSKLRLIRLSFLKLVFFW